MSTAYVLTRLEILARCLLAIPGGYVLALTFCAALAALLTRGFGMARADAFIASAMLAFLVWLFAALMAFAARTTLRAGAWIFLPALLFGLSAWLLSPLPAPGV